MKDADGLEFLLSCSDMSLPREFVLLIDSSNKFLPFIGQIVLGIEFLFEITEDPRDMYAIISYSKGITQECLMRKFEAK